jgi:Na+-transporting methylmalonyl-CoA/oxaloacetate decarboxylase gamma subunit
MTLQDMFMKNGNMTFIGIVAVVFVLALLVLIISILARILRRPSKEEGSNKTGISQADAVPPDVKGSDVEPAEAVLPPEDGNEPGPELMAAIMAALFVVMGQAGFRLRSIRRTGRNAPAWNLSGRDEYHSTRL